MGRTAWFGSGAVALAAVLVTIFAVGYSNPSRALAEDCAAGQVLIGDKCRKLAGTGSSHEPDVSVNPQPPDEPPTQDFQPFRAASWGGIVRDGPGMDYGKLGSLREKELVKVLERTDGFMNGFPWFKISYRDGKIGYHWGGIMCSLDAPRDGLLQTCEGGLDYSGDASSPDPLEGTTNAEGLTWHSKWFNDENRKGAMTSQLILGIPETDALKFFASCAAGVSAGGVVAVFWADVADKTNSVAVRLRVSTDGNSRQVGARVSKPAGGEGLEGYRIIAPWTDDLWQDLALARRISYGMYGVAPVTVDLKGSKSAITNFLSGCKLIVEQQVR